MKTQNSFAYLEAKGKSKVWMAYAEHFANEEILDEGFNPNSGYVYIALENGVTIASSFGQDVDFVIYDETEGQEMFLYSIDELNMYLNR